MSKPKRVSRRGSRRSILLGDRDPRIRRDAQASFDPRADKKEQDIIDRIKKLEEKSDGD